MGVSASRRVPQRQRRPVWGATSLPLSPRLLPASTPGSARRPRSHSRLLRANGTQHTATPPHGPWRQSRPWGHRPWPGLQGGSFARCPLPPPPLSLEPSPPHSRGTRPKAASRGEAGWLWPGSPISRREENQAAENTLPGAAIKYCNCLLVQKALCTRPTSSNRAKGATGLPGRDHPSG